jgi:hypothetical protein
MKHTFPKFPQKLHQINYKKITRTRWGSVDSCTNGEVEMTKEQLQTNMYARHKYYNPYQLKCLGFDLHDIH